MEKRVSSKKARIKKERMSSGSPEQKKGSNFAGR
jgi:hypothetical protein